MNNKDAKTVTTCKYLKSLTLLDTRVGIHLLHPYVSDYSTLDKQNQYTVEKYTMRISNLLSEFLEAKNC